MARESGGLTRGADVALPGAERQLQPAVTAAIGGIGTGHGFHGRCHRAGVACRDVAQDHGDAVAGRGFRNHHHEGVAGAGASGAAGRAGNAGKAGVGTEI